MRAEILLIVIGIVLISGCIQTGEISPKEIIKYQCADGSIVDNIDLCRRVNERAEINTEKKWYIITTFMGNSGKTTETFKIKGDEWRFTWLCNTHQKYVQLGKPDVGSMDITVYPEGSSYGLLSSVSMINCIDGQDTSYVYNNPRNYYLNVFVTNVGNWSVTIEDYY